MHREVANVLVRSDTTHTADQNEHRVNILDKKCMGKGINLSYKHPLTALFYMMSQML